MMDETTNKAAAEMWRPFLYIGVWSFNMYISCVLWLQKHHIQAAIPNICLS